MSDEFVKHLSVDDRLDAYQPFFDHKWAREMQELALGKAKLAELVFDLGLSFKGVSRTASLPLLSVDMAESYSKGHNLGRLSNSLTL